MKSNFHNFIIEEENACKRLDMFLSQQIAGISRTEMQKLITDGQVRVNDRAAGKSYRLNLGDKIVLHMEKAEEKPPFPVAKPLDIIFEDEHIAVINKPKGLVVHQSLGNEDDSIAQRFIHHMGKLPEGPWEPHRPCIVHRLDKDTSGLMVLAKTAQAYLNLKQELESQELKRQYLAIIWGALSPASGRIENMLARDKKNPMKRVPVIEGGKNAITLYESLSVSEKFSYIELELLTGRTHQIRAQMAALGHPLVGDKLYARKQLSKNEIALNGHCLHSCFISFRHPNTKLAIDFYIKPPEVFEAFWEDNK